MATTPAPKPSTTQDVIAAAAGAIPGLIARFSGDNNSAVPPELQQLLAMQIQRQQSQDPLFQAVNNQAFMGLPTYAREGLSPGQLGPLAASKNPIGNGPLGKVGQAAAAGAGGAMSAIPLKKIAELLKKLFQHQATGPMPQGDKPLPGGTGFPTANPFDNTFTGWQDPAALTPNVTTSENFDFSGLDPNAYNPSFTGPSDPSGGSGVGPGLSDFYGGGGSDGQYTDWSGGSGDGF